MSIYWNAAPPNSSIVRSTTVIAGRNVHLAPGKINTSISVAPFVVPEVRAKTDAALSSYAVTSTTLTSTTLVSINPLDGLVLIVGDRVLVDSVGTVNDAQNGIYTVTAVGSGAANWVLTRTSDTIVEGTLVYVSAGTNFARTGWSRIAGDNPVFAQYSATLDLTGGNVGTAGVGVFDSLNANVIELKKITSSAPIVVTDLGAGDSISLSLTQNGIIHANLGSLTSSDDHTQYAHILGRTVPQSIAGGNISGQNLNLRPNSADTSTGSVIVNAVTASSSHTTGAFIVNGGAGIGENLYVNGTGNVAGNMTVGGTINSVNIGTLNSTVGAYPTNLNTLTNTIVAQLATIGTGLNSTRWGYLAAADQPIVSGSNVVFGTIGGTVTTATQPNINHSTLSGLTTGDPHTQYVLANGRGTTQTITAGAGVASVDLVLRSTSNATKGRVLLDETTIASSTTTGALVVSGGVGIGGNVHVGGTSNFTGAMTVSGTINSVNIGTLNSTVSSYAGNLNLLNSTIVTQLSNIGVTVITSTRWAALGAMGSALGLAQLDGTTKLPFSQIPTGTTSTTVSVGDHTHSWRITGTVSADTNVSTTFSLPGFEVYDGAYRVAIYCSTGNGPSAVFEICKSNSSLATNGSVVRVVSQVAGTAELNMQWVHTSRPEVFHNILSGVSTPVTYSFVINA